MFKLRNGSKNEKGFTLIELLVVAAIIGILLAIAIPNLLKARISANEASARKSMQTLRDAEGEFFEQDLDEDGTRDFTNAIGTASGPTASLRQPGDTFTEDDALIDSSFEGADNNGGAVGTGAASASSCNSPKAGYCVSWDWAPGTTGAGTEPTDPFQDFAWGASPTANGVNKTGRRDFIVFGDGVIRCSLSDVATGGTGDFSATKDSPGCD